MKKNKITFLILECIFLILTLFFAWKIFDRDVPEKRVAVILPESGDNRWNSLIKGMKQSAKINNLHMIICNTDEIENAEMEKEIIKEQKRNNIDAFIICPAPGSDTKDMLKKQCAKTPYTLIMEDVYSKEGGNSGNPVIGPDYYKIGSELGKQLGKKRQKIGVVANWKESKSDQDAIRSLLIGFLLYAIAEDPICVFSNGSSTSFRCWRRRMSLENLCALAAIPARTFTTLVSTLRE